ncbi:hypothetical protein BH23ACT10_BH23ACT10_08490 [soil metagenome]
MAHPSRPLRPLPSTPSPDADAGALAGLITRIIIVVTIVLGQLWALTVGLEAYLLGHTDQAWLLAAFSIVSFVVALVLVRVEPPSRSRRPSDTPAPRR